MIKSNKYDLEERTAIFGEMIVKFCKDIKKDQIINPILIQLIKSATSIGANYMEANGASSQKDFSNKIYICKKESQETKHWLRMLSSYYPENKEKLRYYWKETQELTMIFHKIVSTIRIKNALKNKH